MRVLKCQQTVSPRDIVFLTIPFCGDNGKKLKRTIRCRSSRVDLMTSVSCVSSNIFFCCLVLYRVQLNRGSTYERKKARSSLNFTELRASSDRNLPQIPRFHEKNKKRAFARTVGGIYDRYKKEFHVLYAKGEKKK